MVRVHSSSESKLLVCTKEYSYWPCLQMHSLRWRGVGDSIARKWVSDISCRDSTVPWQCPLSWRWGQEGPKQASTKGQTFLHRQFWAPLPSCENAWFSIIFKWAKTAWIVTFSIISNLCTLLSRKMTSFRILQGLGLVQAPWPNAGREKQKKRLKIIFCC